MLIVVESDMSMSLSWQT